jgi:DNA ligase (NAD+)
LETAGLQMSVLQNETNQPGRLTGMTFVISGIFQNHSRDEVQSLIEQNGGRNMSSITRHTDYVVAGENMGPAKKVKAEKLGVPIISEDELLAML